MRSNHLVGSALLFAALLTANVSAQWIEPVGPDLAFKRATFFTPAVASALRARINGALLAHGYTADDVRDAGRANGVDDPRVTLHVNDTFPWLLSVAMFACVLDALPSLPPELQYRIVGDDLLLIDVHAALIVDILPRALVDMTARDW